MTRYRLRTQKKIEVFLADRGEATAREIAKGLEKDLRVIQNYLRHYPGVFKKKPYRKDRWTVWHVNYRN